MKRKVALLLCVLAMLFSGCSNQQKDISKAMYFRDALIESEGCSFLASLGVDFGEETYCFVMECQVDRQGSLAFKVQEPVSISDISGKITYQEGMLTFEDKALSFIPLADNFISPVCLPWLMMQAWEGGYLSTASLEGENLRVAIDDTYQDKSIRTDLWLNENNMPICCDLYLEKERIATIEIKNFRFL